MDRVQRTAEALRALARQPNAADGQAHWQRALNPTRCGVGTEGTLEMEQQACDGFDIEKPLSGMAANQWVPVLELVYKTEFEAKEAQKCHRTYAK